MRDYFMMEAIKMASKGSGFVNPDPLFGIVVVKDGNIIGTGYQKLGNQMSTIENTLSTIGDKLYGAEIYLNIEPNSESIASVSICKSGISKVYIGIFSPEEKFTSKFVNALRTANIEVETGILLEECEELNEIYIHYVKYKTPFVFTKWAMTLDGKLASRTGDSKWISSEGSLQFVHHLRQRVSAIMVGENTVRLDNPLLTTRLEGVEISNPLRIILSKYGDISEEANILKVDEKTRTLIIASTKIPKEKEEMLISKGVEILKLEEVNGSIPFTSIVKALGNLKLDSLYIEGGSGVLGSAFESGIVNKVYCAVAPKIIGGKDAFTPVGGKGIERMRDAIELKRVSHEIIGRDVIIKGYI